MRHNLIILVGILFTLLGCASSPTSYRTVTTTTRVLDYGQVVDLRPSHAANRFYTRIRPAASASFQPVPLHKLANYKSLKKKQTDAEFQAAYDIALQIVTPLSGLPREQQLIGIAQALRTRFDTAMTYSTSATHYNDPYGYFVLGTASCAGCTRATGLCLNILGIPYEHVNENQWKHQWCRVDVNGVYWISDAYGNYAGPEPEPYRHPTFN